MELLTSGASSCSHSLCSIASRQQTGANIPYWQCEPVFNIRFAILLSNQVTSHLFSHQRWKQGPLACQGQWSLLLVAFLERRKSACSFHKNSCATLLEHCG